MSSCERCERWTVKKVTTYGDGSEIQNWAVPSGKGKCGSLGIETDADFGCNRFFEGGGDHVETEAKPLAPWRYFKMIPCPDCNGKGDGGRGHRCAGTGLVRLYDDGYIGDEQTRMHPKERAETPVAPKCPTCSGAVNEAWPFCPSCGGKLLKMAETEVIDDALANLPPAPPPAFPQTLEKHDPVRFEDLYPDLDRLTLDDADITKMEIP